MTEEEVKDLAMKLMAEHGLSDWTLRMDRAVRRFGRCSEATKTIIVSGPISALNGEPQVRDVLLHEIAHALVGAEAKHGPAWKAMATELGARPVACYDESVVLPPLRWLGTAECGHTEESHTRPRGPDRVCLICWWENRDAKYPITWTQNPLWREV